MEKIQVVADLSESNLIMINTIKLITAFFLAGCLHMDLIAKDDIPDLKLPDSWSEYLDSVIKSGDVGTWRTAGITKDLWVGIPAGIRYVNNETIDISDDRKKILLSHEMVTEDGKMLSIGSGFVGWDPAFKRVQSFYSGYDGGKPFWGPRELVGFSSAGEVWKYTETSRGKTYETRIVSKRVSKKIRINITKRADGSGEVSKSELAKVIGEKTIDNDENSVLRTKDEISKRVIKYFDSTSIEDLAYAESFYADNVEVSINKIKVSGKKAYIERLNKIHKVLFKNMKFLDLHVHTNYFSDEALASDGKTVGDLRSGETIWSNAWANIEAVGRLTNKKVTFPIHCDFRWENGKVVEMLAYYDPADMNEEIAALESSQE